MEGLDVAGVPTVCSAVADLPQLLGDAAVMTRPNDFDSLVRACRRVLAEPREAQRRAVLGRRLVRRRLSVSRAAETYLCHYLDDNEWAIRAN